MRARHLQLPLFPIVAGEIDARMGRAGVRFIMAGLARERQRRGLSQVEVARRMGVASSAVSRWERAERDLQLGTFLRYLEAVFSAPVSLGRPPERSRRPRHPARERTQAGPPVAEEAGERGG